MKKTHKIYSIFSFFSKWSLLQKIVLFVGTLILLLTITFVVTEMFEDVAIQATNLRNNPAVLTAIKDSADNFYPQVLATVWRETLTFTVITNFILGIVFIIYAFSWKSRKAQAFVFSAITWISITFIVYWLLISWNSSATWKNPFAAVRSIFLHAIHPISAFVLFGFIKKDFVITRKTLWLNNLLMIGYFGFAFISFFAGDPVVNLAVENGVARPYRVTDTVIYTFLNFREPIFYRGGNIGVVLILDLGLFLLGIFLSPGLAHLIKFAYKVKVEKKLKQPLPKLYEDTPQVETNSETTHNNSIKQN